MCAPTTCSPITTFALPTAVLDELVAEGVVGGRADDHFSVIGYQEAGLRVWRNETAPAIISRLREDGADASRVATGAPGTPTARGNGRSRAQSSPSSSGDGRADPYWNRPRPGMSRGGASVDRPGSCP
jgi:hypothetical protein